MNDKNFIFLSGLPRSGSSLLCALLGQNQELYVSGTSGILDMCLNVRNHWPKLTEFQAMDPKISTARRVNTIKGMFNGFYADVEQNTVIDKSRHWPAHLEMASAVFGKNPKVIVTVRDVRDVLASFEKKWRETKSDTQVSQEALNSIEYQTVDGRCRTLCNTSQIVGSAVVTIKDAVDRGWKKCMHFVEYEELTSETERVVDGIYNFLEIDRVSHNTKNVKSNVIERDEVYGWKDLHAIRPVIQKQDPQWPKYLPAQVASQYEKEAKFWRSL